MSLDNLAQLITLGACIIVIIICEPALNRCTINTRRCVRLSLLLICAGAVLIAGAIIPGVLPSPWPGSAALASGVALMLFTTRRRRIFNAHD